MAVDWVSDSQNTVLGLAASASPGMKCRFSGLMRDRLNLKLWGGAQQTATTSPPGDSDTGSVVLPEVLTPGKGATATNLK